MQNAGSRLLQWHNSSMPEEQDRQTGQLIVHALHTRQTSSGLWEDTELAGQALEKFTV